MAELAETATTPPEKTEPTEPKKEEPPPKKDLAGFMAEGEEWINTKAPLGFKNYFPLGGPYTPTKAEARNFADLSEEEYAAQTTFAHNLRLCDQPEKDYFRLFSCDQVMRFPRDTVKKEDLIEVSGCDGHQSNPENSTY